MSIIHGQELSNYAKEYIVNVLGSGTLNGTLMVCLFSSFPREKYEFNSNNMPIYSGYNFNADATITTADWVILKQEFATTGHRQDSQILIGAWNNHTNLSWAFSSTT